MNKKKHSKVETMIYKGLHRKLKIEQKVPYYKPGVNSGDPEGRAVPAPRGTRRVTLVTNLMMNHE